MPVKNPIIHEDGMELPILYNIYCGVKSVGIYAGIGALAGRVFKWYTPTHGAVMGGLSGVTAFVTTRLAGNRWAAAVADEYQGDDFLSEHLGEKVTEFGMWLATPLLANVFVMQTGFGTLARYHLSASFVGGGIYWALKRATISGMNEVGLPGTWFEQWAEREWFTREKPDLPPCDGEIDWENFTRVPPNCTIDEDLPEASTADWEALCNRLTSKSDDPFPTIENALRDIEAKGRTQAGFRYAGKVATQLYHKLKAEPDDEKLRTALLNLQQEFRACQSQWLRAVYRALQAYEAGGSSITYWALTVDQEVREEIISNDMARQFEPWLRDVHRVELIRKHCAEEAGLEKPGGVDGHTMYEDANDGAREQMEAMDAIFCGALPTMSSFDVDASNSRQGWVWALKARYHPEVLHATFKERIRLGAYASGGEQVRCLKQLDAFLGEEVARVLGISMAKAKELTMNELQEWKEDDEDIESPVGLNDAGVTLFLKAAGFFKPGGEIMPDRSNAQLVSDYS